MKLFEKKKRRKIKNEDLKALNNIENILKRNIDNDQKIFVVIIDAHNFFKKKEIKFLINSILV